MAGQSNSTKRFELNLLGVKVILSHVSLVNLVYTILPLLDRKTSKSCIIINKNETRMVKDVEDFKDGFCSKFEQYVQKLFTKNLLTAH